jgi:hypothetical protein
MDSTSTSISCEPKTFYLNFGVNVFVHVVFLFTILTALFILFISRISSTAINNELTHLVNHSVDKRLNKIPVDQKNK